MKRVLVLLLLLGIALALPLSSAAQNRSELDLYLGDVRNPQEYTAETWAPYQRAVLAAKAVYDNPAATQEQIDAAALSLKQAIEALSPHLDRDSLLSFADQLEEEFLFNNAVLLPESLCSELENAASKYRTRAEADDLTAEEIAAFSAEFATLIERAEDEARSQVAFDENAPEQGVIVPSDLRELENRGTSSRLATLRLIISIIGGACAILGIVAVIFYLKPPKFFR